MAGKLYYGTDAPLSTGPHPDPLDEHWSVTVERKGQQVVTIEQGCLSGREISKDDEQAIRSAAHHLLAFIGDPHPAGAQGT